MMRRWVIAGLVLQVMLIAPLAAQDSTAPGPRAPTLRHRIEERFAVRIQEQLGLSNEQMAKLRATTVKFGGRRRELERSQLAIRRALDVQLRPGIAANRDSVARLMDNLLGGRVAYAQTYRDESSELKSYLNPVQRAQLMTMRERLLRHARQFRERRGESEGMGGHRGLFMER
jgi:hypothetical protein